MAHFFLNKPKSKRIAALRSHALKLSLSDELVAIQICLPERMLLQQINLHVARPAEGPVPASSKAQSDFSKRYFLRALLRSSDLSAIAVRSAFSETTTRTGVLEYNVAGSAQAVTLVFARDDAAIELAEVDLRMSAQAEELQLEDRLLEMVKRGENVGTIISEDDDDVRILDSLPHQVGARKKGSQAQPAAPPAPQDDQFAALLDSI